MFDIDGIEDMLDNPYTNFDMHLLTSDSPPHERENAMQESPKLPLEDGDLARTTRAESQFPSRAAFDDTVSVDCTQLSRLTSQPAARS